MTEGVKILVVEDSPVQARQLERILDQDGYEVMVTHNGRQALDALAWYRPTLVISDIVMPEMDGYELCRAIKAEPHLSDIPVILLTVLSDPGDIIRGLESGANSFMVKPYNAEALSARIRYILANLELRRLPHSEVGMNIIFGGHKYFIDSERIQIIDLLISTYETAVQKNLELEQTRRNYRALLYSNTNAIVVVGDRDRRVRFVNPAAESLFERVAAELVDRPFAFPVSPGPVREMVIERQRGDNVIAELHVVETRWCDEEAYLVSLHDITERKWAEAERERLIVELQDALDKIRTLKGLLPICASCKKIRDDQGYWQEVEVYVSSHTDADFTHGICPDCAEKLYPDFFSRREPPE